LSKISFKTVLTNFFSNDILIYIIYERRSFLKNRIISKFVCIAVLSVLLFSVTGSSLALSSELGTYDLSRPGFAGETYNNEYGVDDLFSSLSVGATKTELEYLDSIGVFSVVYPKSIPSSYVGYSHDSSVLTIRAEVYSYVASSGATATWIPDKATLSGSSEYPFSLVGEEYIAELPLEDFSSSLYVDISYSSSVKVPKTVVNDVLLRAFRDGKSYYEASIRYEQELAEYTVCKQKYDTDIVKYNELYTDYEAKLAIYKKYLSDKKIYDELYSDYTAYLSELKKYNSDLVAYNDYLKAVEKYRADYQAYLASEEKKASLADEILEYEAYLAALDLVNYRLSLVESLKTKVSHLERNVYDAIMGDTVTAVIENEDIIAGNLIGADREAVELAGKSTSWLRILFKDYFSKESDEDKYIYYKLNYRRFRDNISNLFKSLDNLYQNERVRELLKANDKDEKYRILLAQLYFASLGFSDSDVYDFSGEHVYNESYLIGGTDSPAALVDAPDYYPDKNCAEPLAADVYPTEVAKPDYVPVPEPTAPREVKEPTAPTEVAEPTLPAKVEEPIAPVKPEEPIRPVAPYESGSSEQMIAEAYFRGELEDRAGKLSNEDYTVNLNVTMKKSLGASSVCVVYHDADGVEVGTVTLDSGSFAEIDYVPEKPSDARADYLFSGWIDADGELVDLNSVGENLSVYPKFEERIRYYSVIFAVGSDEVAVSLPYGALPTAPDSPSISGNDSVAYSFAGWSEDGVNACEITEITGNTRYVALFEPVYTVPLASGGADISRTDGAVIVDLKSKSYSKVDISRLLEMADGQVIFKLSESDVTVPYGEILALKENGAASVEISLLESTEYSEYFVRFLDGAGDVLSYSAKLSVSVKTAHSGSDLRLFTVNSVEREYFRFNFEEDRLSFNLNTGHTVRLAKENTVSTFPNELVSITLSASVASPGESVRISAEAPEGVRIKGFYYVGTDGKRVAIEGDMLVMPSSSVTVGVDAEIVYYTVIFISDGVIISQAKYRYGDTVKVPTAPTKPDDGEFSYKFKGWSADVSPVVADATYIAEFTSTALAPKEPDDGLKISDGVMNIIVTAVLTASLFFFAVIPALVISVLNFLKRRRLGIGFARPLRKNP